MFHVSLGFAAFTKAAGRLKECFIFNVHMHEVTPSAVAIADSTLMAVWIANFQNVLFFMVQNFNV